MPHALSHRASQKPSRPASKATAMRLILCPAFSASTRHRSSSFSNSFSSVSSFFKGWRSTPGTMPATSQLFWLISMTAINVSSTSSVVRDQLRSFSGSRCFGLRIGGSIGGVYISADGCHRSVNSFRPMQCPRRIPHRNLHKLRSNGDRLSTSACPSTSEELVRCCEAGLAPTRAPSDGWESKHGERLLG